LTYRRKRKEVANLNKYINNYYIKNGANFASLLNKYSYKDCMLYIKINYFFFLQYIPMFIIFYIFIYSHYIIIMHYQIIE